jgi:hypothetical protein
MKDGLQPHPDRAMVAALNAGTNLIAEIRRSAGPRTATRALPGICAKLGIEIDLSVSETLAQGVLSLSEPTQSEKDA